MDEQKKIDALKGQLNKIDNLLKKERHSSEFKGWEAKTARVIERIFGSSSTHLKDFNEIQYSLMVFSGGASDVSRERVYRSGLEDAKEILNSIVEELEEFGSLEFNSLKDKPESSGVTVNLNQTLNISLTNVLENNLTVSQYGELSDILKISDKKEKENKILDFLSGLGTAGVIEILKSILLG
ncbi:hypothetical protein ACFL08_00695 [Patescibacteria group bacterium]